MCGPAAHSFKPILDGGVRVLYCEHCGNVRELAPTVAIEHRGWNWKETREDIDLREHPVIPNAKAPAVDDLERTVQDLEADVLERIRDGIGSGESWSSILNRAGIDPASDFARNMASKAGVQREVGFHEVNDLPLFKEINPPTDRGPVGELSPEERALIEESNRYEQRRRIVGEDDRLDAGL